jgi:MSHA type pilus biogenesis protein MshL
MSASLKIFKPGMAMLLLCGCTGWQPEPFSQSQGHIASSPSMPDDIPELVQKVPILPMPETPPVMETYTVVVNEIPVKELLFALARDAGINVDIDPTVAGVVTLNVVDQTLPQILDRLSRQVSLRYKFAGADLIIQADVPYFRTYRIDYLNIERDTSSAITIATQIATTGGGYAGGGDGKGSAAGSAGGNNSITDVKSSSMNHFWETLAGNILAMLGDSGPVTSANVIPIPEAGMLTVKATSQQHEQIQKYIDDLLASANRQVLIQATIVEVDLNEEYQAGIDWSFVNKAAGLTLSAATLPGATVPTALSLFQLVYNTASQSSDNDLKITVNLLDEFGEARVLSSPQVMVLNNQTAVLKVVDNEVFFTIEAKTTQNQTNSLTSVETDVHTVPVGIVMPVTAHINANGSVILNVRPTISRVVNRVEDPNPTLRFAPDGTPLDHPITSSIPEIRVREMESVLRMHHGQIAVLGGLMQDSNEGNSSSVPGASVAPLIGNMFRSRSKVYSKTELVIFLRPIIVHYPNIHEDLKMYGVFLEDAMFSPQAAKREAP